MSDYEEMADRIAELEAERDKYKAALEQIADCKYAEDRITRTIKNVARAVLGRQILN